MARKPTRRIKRASTPRSRRKPQTHLPQPNGINTKSKRNGTPRRVSRTRLKTEVRYSDDWKSGRVQPLIHANTYNRCCWCHTRRSTQIHHAAYTDNGGKVKEDELSRAGVLLFPVCDRCHIPILHSSKYWIVPERGALWDSRNKDTAIARLRLGYQILSKGIYH